MPRLLHHISARYRVALGGFRFFPALPEKRGKSECLKRKHDNCSSENSPLNAKTAFRRFPRTKPDVPSLGLIKGYFTEESGCDQSFFRFGDKGRAT